MSLVKLEKPIRVQVSYEGYEVELFTFTHMNPATKTYYTENRAAHLSQATLDKIERGELQWLRLA